ncbi:hypothetical protein ABKV19_013651 [Rosa sericea]
MNSTGLILADIDCFYVQDIGNSDLSKFASTLNSGKFGYSKKEDLELLLFYSNQETGKRDEIGNCLEQQMNDNQKDEVICERSKMMKWSATDM